MKILVTGGGGYVGSHVMKMLGRQGIACLAYDDFSTGHKESLAEGSWVEGDITDSRTLHRVFSDFKPDAVIHLAALATQGACFQRPEDCHRINVEGTRITLEAMHAHHVNCIIFASSCAVYEGSATCEPLREDGPLGVTAPYGASKLAGEQLLAEYAQKRDIRFIMFRMFNVAGADPEGLIGEQHNPETHLLPLVIATALGKQKTLDIYGDDYPTADGTAIRDYIHVWDVAEAFMLAARQVMREDTSLILNLGSGIPTSINQLLAAARRITGSSVPVTLKPRREGDAPWLLADMAKTRRALDWQPKYSDLDIIIKTALQWHRKT